MYNFEWDMENLEKFLKEFTYDNFNDAMADATKDLGNYFLKTVRVRTPVDTGNLKADWSRHGNLSRMPKIEADGVSIHYENAAINARGGNPTIYTSMVEEGYHTKNGRWIPGHWFIKASENKTAERMHIDVEKHLRKFVNRGVSE